MTLLRLLLLSSLLWLWLSPGADAFLPSVTKAPPSPLTYPLAAVNGDHEAYSKKAAFDAAVLGRYACRHFRRSDGTPSGSGPTQPNPDIVQSALQCLELARRSPSAFNTQPYRLVLVHEPEQKAALARWCLGPNANRVLDSDCSVVFCADKQVLRTLGRFRASVKNELASLGITPNPRLLAMRQLHIAVFSSGYPLPRFLSAILGWLVRVGVSLVHLLTWWFYPMPSLSSAETWAAKQATMVAMTYMLACSARNMATIPMEGIQARGIRRALGIPSRYAIPLVVATGMDYQAQDKEARKSVTRRYEMDEVIFGNQFGSKLELPRPQMQAG